MLRSSKAESPLQPPALPGPAGMFSLSGGEDVAGEGRAVSPGERESQSAPAARLTRRRASGDERWLSRLNAVREEECSGRRGLAAGEA